jgi:hypothetical protein
MSSPTSPRLTTLANFRSSTLDDDLTVNVTFTFDSAHAVRLNRPTPVHFSTLKEAHDAALPGEIIQAWGVEFTENLPVSKSIIIKGGVRSELHSHEGPDRAKGEILHSQRQGGGGESGNTIGLLNRCHSGYQGVACTHNEMT